MPSAVVPMEDDPIEEVEVSANAGPDCADEGRGLTCAVRKPTVTEADADASVGRALVVLSRAISLRRLWRELICCERPTVLVVARDRRCSLEICEQSMRWSESGGLRERVKGVRDEYVVMMPRR